MIRPYHPTDRAALLALLQLHIPRYFAPAEADDFASYLDRELEDYFVFEADGQILGAGGINYFWEEKTARLSWDIVHPGHQGQGIGKALALHRLGIIRSHPGIEQIVVRTTQLAHAFYHQLGFVLEKMEKDYWAPGFDLYQMRMAAQPMPSLEASVSASLDGGHEGLFPYLPYILQDLWEMGTDPALIIRLVREHVAEPVRCRVLDLGCGKGAVSIRLAQELGCRCHGIDALPAFIAEAQAKAAEYQLAHLCTFETGDIRERVGSLPGYDVIVLGAIGPVLGDYYTTLTALGRCLEPGGLIFIDDCYVADESAYTHPIAQKRADILQQAEAASMKILDELPIAPELVSNANDIIYKKLKARCLELMDLYPDKRSLFESYLQEQEAENKALERELVGVVLVLAGSA
jgi:ribosomal protein S18 acetylase RimI-like enzyme/SAM-dependent methyltransferase